MDSATSEQAEEKVGGIAGILESFKGFPKAFWVVNTFELFERGAYYGMMAVLARHLQRNLDLSASFIGSLIAFMIILLYATPLIAAALAEKYGYKQTLFFAFIVLISGYAAGVFATDEYSIIIAVVLLGIGAGVFKPMVSATIAQVTREDQRNLGYSIYYWLINFGAALTPLTLSIFFEEEFYNYVFAVSAVLVSINLVILIFAFQNPVERNPDKKVTEVLVNAVLVLKDVRFSVLLAIYSGFWFMFSMNHSFLPLYMKNFGIMPGWFETTHLAAINPGVIIILGPVLGKIVEKYDSIKVMIVGISLFILGFSMVGLTQLWFLFIAGIVVFSIGEYITHPNFISYTSKIAPKENLAIYMGYVFMPIMVGQNLGTLAGGYLYDYLAEDLWRPQVFWAVYLSVGLLTVVAFIIYHKVFGSTREEVVEARDEAVEADLVDEKAPEPFTQISDAPISFVDRLWASPTYIIAALLMIPVLFGFAAAQGQLEYVESDDEEESSVWWVTFTENEETGTETQTVANGEQLDFRFDLDPGEQLGYVEIDIEYTETDESGVWGINVVCDDVDAVMDMEGVSDGWNQSASTLSGSSGGGSECSTTNPDISLLISVTSGYDGEAKEEHGTLDEVEQRWSDNDSGRGEYVVLVTVSVNVGAGHGVATDNSEDIMVSWRAVTYTADIEEAL